MSLFTSSPTAPGKGGAPNNAILAFVSHEERKRFKTTFEYQSILSPLITMDTRPLLVNDVTSERNNSVTAQCQEHGPDRGSSHRGSSHQNGNYDERSYNYPSYPYYSGGTRSMATTTRRDLTSIIFTHIILRPDMRRLQTIPVICQSSVRLLR